MGQSFAILVWDSWGAGLVRVNPRLVTDGTFDMYGNPVNNWSYSSEEDKKAKIAELSAGYKYCQIIE